MRVSYNQLYQGPLTRILELQSSTSDLQVQVASGLRVVTPGDDPVAAAAIMQTTERMAAMTQYDRNGVHAEQRLQQVDDVMGGVSHALQRVNELLLQGRSEVLDAADRRALAQEVREQLDVIVDLGNTRNASGEYIFAGASVTTRPFTRDASGTVNYNGDSVVRHIQISETQAVAEGFSGDAVLMAVRNGNGEFVTGMGAGNTGTAQISNNVVADPTVFQKHDYRISFTSPTTYDVIDDTLGATVLAAQTYVDGGTVSFDGVEITVFGTPAAGDEFTVGPSRNQSVFETIDNIATLLETDFNTPAETARFGFEADRALEDLALAIEKTSEVRASAGARLNAVDGQRRVHEDVAVNLENLRSSLQDIDIAVAISDLARETTALEAAQASFVRIQSLSLFNFL